MKTNMLLIITTIFIFSSCFKSVQKGEADDIIKTFIYEKEGKSYLISHESLFQVTSKSQNGGMTNISGWYDTRISVYDLETGQIVVRKEFGDITEDENELILGCTNDHIWLYSVDEDKGLYAIDPLSLEVILTQEDFFNINPALKEKFALPKYYEIRQFFGFNEKTQELIITDNQAFRYTVNPKSLKAVKQNAEMRIPDYDFDDYLGNYRAVHKKPKDFNSMEDYHDYMQNLIEYDLEGNNRKTVSVNNKVINPDITFLEGKFILVRELGEEDTPVYLQTDENTFFIAHRSSTNNDAKLIISCIQIKLTQGTGDLKESIITVTKKWELAFDDLFFDYSAAEGSDEFEDLYPKGDPDFDFQFFTTVDSKLIMIYGLRRVGIDTETGKILWEFRI